jgi:hypothetical protein
MTTTAAATATMGRTTPLLLYGWTPVFLVEVVLTHRTMHEQQQSYPAQHKHAKYKI